MNSNAKYFIAGLLILIGAIGVGFYSCEKEEITPNETTPTPDPEELTASRDNTIRTDEPWEIHLVAPENTCGDPERNFFHLKDNSRVGGLSTYNDGRNLYFKFGFKAEYRLQKAYIHIALDQKKIPVDKMGNPDVEAFKYQSFYSEQAKSYLVKVPLSDFKQKACLIAFAVDLVNSDDKPMAFRSWAGEVPFGETIKGAIMKYSVEPCLVDTADSNDAAE